jgi:acyl carrier protein
MNEVLELLKEIRPEEDFESDTDFIEDGMLDSFDIVTLVAELDKKYGISIEGVDIIPEYFKSLKAIMTLLEKYGKKP